MEIEGIWKQSTEENARTHIDERTKSHSEKLNGTYSTLNILTEEDLDGLDMHTNFGRET
jgi:hypothetical protein